MGQCGLREICANIKGKKKDKISITKNRLLCVDFFYVLIELNYQLLSIYLRNRVILLGSYVNILLTPLLVNGKG